MSTYRLSHLDDATLLSELSNLVARDRATTAELLAHIAEVDERRLYLPAGYSSMFAYCLGELRLSEDATYKRIQAARAGRRFPRLFEDVAAGRLHLTAVGLIAPHLTPENVDALVDAAADRRKAELEAWLAERFGAAPPALRARVTVIKPAAVHREPAPAQVDGPPSPELALAQVDVQLAPAQVAAPRYLVQLPIGEATHAKLRRAQALLAHAVPSGALDEVLDRALDALLERLEKRKGAASVAKRAEPRTASGRTIPAKVRREVWQRDGGRCTFEGRGGHRCDARRLLEFDHAIPFARGGVSTVDGLRLRCRAHNQLEADRAFGRDFMQKKRAAADPEVESALRGLGCRAEEARRAAVHAAALGRGTIEDRLRGALQFLGAQRATAAPA